MTNPEPAGFIYGSEPEKQQGETNTVQKRAAVETTILLSVHVVQRGDEGKILKCSARAVQLKVFVQTKTVKRTQTVRLCNRHSVI